LTPDDNAAFYSPLYVPQAGTAGQVAGPLAFEGNEVNGDFGWRKPPQTKGAFWPGGFSQLVVADGGRYLPPARGFRVITPESLRLELTGPITGGSFAETLQLTSQNKFVFALPNLAKLKLKHNQATGAMTGSYFDSGLGRTLKLEGVILQGEQRAGGFYLGTSSAGTWNLAAPPPP
jgi:hypothetical protein